MTWMLQTLLQLFTKYWIVVSPNLIDFGPFLDKTFAGTLTLNLSIFVIVGALGFFLTDIQSYYHGRLPKHKHRPTIVNQAPNKPEV